MSAHHRRPKASQHPNSNGLTDERLLEMLLGKAPLTASQAEAFVGYSVALASGQLRQLPNTVRDHAVAVARANGLLVQTMRKKRPGQAEHLGYDDNFSIRRTAGTERADEILGTRLSDDGRRIVKTKDLPLKPPGRAA